MVLRGVGYNGGGSGDDEQTEVFGVLRRDRLVY